MWMAVYDNFLFWRLFTLSHKILESEGFIFYGMVAAQQKNITLMFLGAMFDKGAPTYCGFI